ncbi:MAG: DnaJ domain-containing protein [Tatlockia sp.]|jgi:hypothetical protein
MTKSNALLAPSESALNEDLLAYVQKQLASLRSTTKRYLDTLPSPDARYTGAPWDLTFQRRHARLLQKCIRSLSPDFTSNQQPLLHLMQGNAPVLSLEGTVSPDATLALHSEGFNPLANQITAYAMAVVKAQQSLANHLLLPSKKVFCGSNRVHVHEDKRDNEFQLYETLEFACFGRLLLHWQTLKTIKAKNPTAFRGLPDNTLEGNKSVAKKEQPDVLFPNPSKKERDKYPYLLGKSQLWFVIDNIIIGIYKSQFAIPNPIKTPAEAKEQWEFYAALILTTELKTLFTGKDLLELLGALVKRNDPDCIQSHVESVNKPANLRIYEGDSGHFATYLEAKKPKNTQEFIKSLNPFFKLSDILQLLQKDKEAATYLFASLFAPWVQHIGEKYWDCSRTSISNLIAASTLIHYDDLIMLCRSHSKDTEGVYLFFVAYCRLLGKKPSKASYREFCESSEGIWNTDLNKPEKPYYDRLGLNENTSLSEVQKQFRKLARASHPDRNSAPDAEAKHKELSEAYVAIEQYLKSRTVSSSDIPSNYYEMLDESYSRVMSEGFALYKAKLAHHYKLSKAAITHPGFSYLGKLKEDLPPELCGDEEETSPLLNDLNAYQLSELREIIALHKLKEQHPRCKKISPLRAIEKLTLPPLLPATELSTQLQEKLNALQSALKTALSKCHSPKKIAAIAKIVLATEKLIKKTVEPLASNTHLPSPEKIAQALEEYEKVKLSLPLGIKVTLAITAFAGAVLGLAIGFVPGFIALGVIGGAVTACLGAAIGGAGVALACHGLFKDRSPNKEMEDFAAVLNRPPASNASIK